MTDSKGNFYNILGCEPNASYEEIKKCYHEQIKRIHPDKATGKGTEEEFLNLDRAWKTLRDAEARREYDLKMEMNESPVYCEIDLSDMDRDKETRTYSYACRCGAFYVLHSHQLSGCHKLKVYCDECTFHILVTCPAK